MNRFEMLFKRLWKNDRARQEDFQELASVSGPEELRRLVRELDAIDDDAIDQSNPGSADELDDNWVNRHNLANVLGAAGERALEILVPALTSYNPETRGAVARKKKRGQEKEKRTGLDIDD